MTRHDDRSATTDPAAAPSEIAIAVDRLVTNGLKALAGYHDQWSSVVNGDAGRKCAAANLDQYGVRPRA